jgi:TPR repeat protein
MDNINDSIKYYKLSIEDHNNINAMYNLGNIYMNNKNDIDNAIKYFKLAVNKNDKRSMNNLGIFFFK